MVEGKLLPPNQCQICHLAAHQVKKQNFHVFEHSFHTLKPSDLKLASTEEDQRKPHSNPVVNALRRYLTAVCAKVMGTNESRIKIHSYIWGMCVMNGPPSIWLTINTTDTHNPVTQVFTGAEIDLEHFDRTAGPDAYTHAVHIADDPYAASKFFHFTTYKHNSQHSLWPLQPAVWKSTAPSKRNFWHCTRLYWNSRSTRMRNSPSPHAFMAQGCTSFKGDEEHASNRRLSTKGGQLHCSEYPWVTHKYFI